MADIAPDTPGPAAPAGVSASPSPRPAWLCWLLVPVGLAAAWAWLSYAPGVIGSITYDTQIQAAVVFYLALFAPLIVLAAILGLVGGVRVFRPGRTPGLFGGLGLVMGCLGLCVAVAYAWLGSGLGAGVGSAIGPTMLSLGLVLTLIQSGAEEVLVRGWLQRQIEGQIGALPAVVLSAAMFAGLHLAAGPVAIHSLINMVLAGCFFGALAWRSGGIVAPVAAHFAWNATEDIGFGLVPNPGIGPFGALRDVELIGPVLWGGGEEGLNASIGTTIVLAALILPLLARMPRARLHPA